MSRLHTQLQKERSKGGKPEGGKAKTEGGKGKVSVKIWEGAGGFIPN